MSETGYEMRVEKEAAGVARGDGSAPTHRGPRTDRSPRGLGDSSPSFVPASWPLTGRGAEQAVLAEAIAAAKQAGVVLAGLAGVGKTRLALEALKEAERQGCCTTWVVATRAAEPIPFGPFAHLLRHVPAASASRLDLLNQIGEALIARAEGRRLVVGVDDAHLLDEASAALVHQLVTSRAAFVLLTLRAGERAPDPVMALWKDGLAERLELQALSEQEVGELVPRVLGGQVDARTMARLWSGSRGNALFLRELVLAGIEGGALAEAGGVWSWKGPMAMSLRLQEIVAARLGVLAPDQVALMEVVAHGEPASAHALEQLFLPATLEAAERRGMVTVEPDGRRTLVRLAHPLYGEVARARCPTLRARVIHRELAAALEATGGRRDEDVLRLATFRLQAGEAGRPDVLLAGARRALAAFDHRLSERLARAAADAGGGVPAKLAIARSLVDEGRFGEAAELLSDIDDIEMTEAERVAATIVRVYAVWMGLGQPAEAERILERAERMMQDRTLRDELGSMRAGILFMAGQPHAAITTALDILDRAQASPSDAGGSAPSLPGRRPWVGLPMERQPLVQTGFPEGWLPDPQGGGHRPESLRHGEEAPAAALVAGLAWAGVGRAEKAVAVVDRWTSPARHVGQELPFPDIRLCDSPVAKAFAFLLAGRLAEARAISEEAHREAIARNDQQLGGLWAGILGEVALLRGRVAAAARWLREGAAVLCGPTRNVLPYCLAMLARALVHTGELTEADAALAEAEAAMSPAAALFESPLGLARAWVAAGHGEMSRARRHALEAADRAEAQSLYPMAVVALHEMARFGEPRPSRLSALASLVDGPFACACALHTAALAAGDGRRLDEAAASFAAMGADLLAAEAAAEAAALHRTEGRKAAMLASSARAQMYLGVCEGARTPALSALATPRLTPREREIATLVESGMSSPEIAHRLVLSTRTVETHLQRVFAKLGVSSRHELHALAPLLGSDDGHLGMTSST